MLAILETPLTIAAYLYLFWAGFVLSMGIYRAHLNGKLTGLNKILGYPLVALFALMDAGTNYTLAWAIFMDKPQEKLVTARLKRYMAGEDGWRKRVADYICNSVLDIFDPSGDHC